MSSENASLTLEEVQKKVIPIDITFVTIIAILMLIGVIGNASVIYIYSFVLKNTTVHYFITVLAVFDFICCLFSFPMEMIEFYPTMYLNYPSDGLCKFQRFLTYCCSTGSIIILLLISIERYRKVCCPVSYQLNKLHARYFTIGAGILSVLLAIPMTLFASKTEIQLKSFKNLTGCECHLSEKYSTVSHIYFIFVLVFTTITLAVMLILYSLLLRTAKTHFLQSDSRYKRNTNYNEAASSPAKRQLSRTNRTMILVTVLFAISFFPPTFLSVFVKALRTKMNYTEEIIFSMFVRMYVFNSSFNPLIYGFCNNQFRNTFLQLLRKIFCLSVDIPSTSTEAS